MTNALQWNEESGPWAPPRRRVLRSTAKRWLVRCAALRASATRPEDGVAILAYHATPSARDHAWWVDFRGQMATLDDLGYEVIPLAEAVDRIRSCRVGSGPSVAITFDDGWASNVGVAFPELARRGWPSSVFLTTSFIGRKPFLHPDDVRRLGDFGVEAELHTDRHPDLTTLDEASILDELRRCRARIEDLTGRTPRFLCYPFGRVDPRVRDVVAASGVAAACAGIPGRNGPGADLYRLRRVTLDPGDGPPDLRAGLAGGPARLAALRRALRHPRGDLR